MNLIGVDAQENEEPDMPGEHAGPGSAADDERTNEEEVPGALPPGQLGEEARIVVMDDVGPDGQRADDWGILGAVGVLQPMDEAGQEIS